MAMSTSVASWHGPATATAGLIPRASSAPTSKLRLVSVTGAASTAACLPVPRQRAAFLPRPSLSSRLLSSASAFSPSLPALSAQSSPHHQPHLPPRPPGALRVRARGGGGGGSVPVPDRIISSAVYFLPLLDGARYARFLYAQYPFTRVLLDPIIPLVQAYNSFPYAGLVLFFLLYLAVIRNPNFDRYVRYNAMQAVILDILMILPSLLERLFAGNDGISLQLTIIFYNTVFLYLFACFVFGVVSCLLGKTPRLPIVAEAADAQVPF
ncbi:hypothetical protein CLOM_g4479 [Closterium sp. NIES-68]|nr:hypothetical protein CLOM_g4479 [Closterium sp. NIES-68]GJP81990.1 hypothetical protein CLOP_g12115 [Closterium sp. NIES-67]